ncbi:MAG: sodium:solute symporter [Bacteroidetes bacterium GWF2_43_63]|nr:MAG: sodium:solute symporter [Bacteroidetes bacterium GWE2_42_42]OFY53572.1 MAG: sodium:solute symporter [Bacteroidetes bacterium GWF2_43_63]HBG71097.1 sodium:solute symporter [Bacteroidales bacterium]HCB63674.1 sodium:solute symporter [Bacteroidales bacterium]HCY24423.1 sodium:solute symporter [Bacteroidales bacterium]
MNPNIILLVFVVYTMLLFFITWLTSRRANNETYFIGNRRSIWYVVAYGMIGASLSGVTFMSVPGMVEQHGFAYFMVVIGYFIGYQVVAFVLLPLYYKLNLTSIYTYLDQRFGNGSYKAGSLLFILSRSLGASMRMFLVVLILQNFLFDALGIPFVMTAVIFISLVLLYTFQGGIKTIVWTDTLQTTFMLGALVFTLFAIASQLDMSIGDLFSSIADSKYSNMIVSDFNSKDHWLKQLLSGIFITITMTGLDQEMMQKNLSCRNLRDAQKNMVTFSFIVVGVTLLFLVLGAALYIYTDTMNIVRPALADDLFATVSFTYLPAIAGFVFLIGLISAAYPSADGAITSLTTSFSLDILRINRKEYSEKKQKRIRLLVHFSFALLLLGLIILFSTINDRSIIDKLFTIAGYTYGPLLGLFAFGLFTKRPIRDKLVFIPVIVAPVLCYILANNSKEWFGGYQVGFELLIINGLLTFMGLWGLSRRGVRS